jgi:transposase
MARYYDEPDIEDDGSFITIHYNEILPQDHPARFIREFIQNCDISSFESRYSVGPGQVGRPPKGIRMMLEVILYAIYKRIYSAHQIEKATHTYADFWFFTHGKKISHDVISEFINTHSDNMKALFVETIRLAEKNGLMSFSSIYVDGFMVKANASKGKNYTLRRIAKKRKDLDEALATVLQKLQEAEDQVNLIKEKADIEEKMSRISELKEELNRKIASRLKGKRPDKVKESETSERINATDPDSSLMKMKDQSYANAYLKINALDGKADILVGSVVEGHYDESHNAIKVFNESNENCITCGRQFQKICFDSGFNTLGSCTSFKAMDVIVIAPTRQHENETRENETSDKKVSHHYNGETNSVVCSEGNVLTQKSQHVEAAKGTIFKKFWNIEACRKCARISECTKNKQGYFQARVDVRQPIQQEALSRYLSEEGKELYRKRSHVAETYQGDLKKNGNFDRFFRRGLKKVRIESLILDTVWNLRRIFNEKGMQIAWN